MQRNGSNEMLSKCADTAAELFDPSRCLSAASLTIESCDLSGSKVWIECLAPRIGLVFSGLLAALKTSAALSSFNPGQVVKKSKLAWQDSGFDACMFVVARI